MMELEDARNGHLYGSRASELLILLKILVDYTP